MNSDGFHLAGDLLRTTAAAIYHALAALPGIGISDSGEPKLETEDYDFAIYPIDDRAEGDTSFLITGNIWLPIDEVRALVRSIGSALVRGGIGYSFELSHDKQPVELSSSAAPKTDQARSRIVVGDRLRSGTSDEVRSGSLAADPSVRLLLSFSTKHSEPYERLRTQLALPFEGVAALEYLGAADAPADGTGPTYGDVLAERLPMGRAASGPMAEPALVQLGAAVATVVARVHAAGQAVGGIRPELIYFDGPPDEPRFSGLVPRGPTFMATAPMTRGMRTYFVPYLSPEQFLGNQPGMTSPASDVFALCASLWTLATGKHPFGDPEPVMALLGRLTTGALGPWPGTAQLGALLARGMATPPRDRPTAAALAAELANR